MRKTLLIIIVFSLGLGFSAAQSIQELMDEVTTANLQLVVSELSGEQATIINGVSQSITSRVESSNDLTADYLEERLMLLPGLTVEVQEFNLTGKNVIATQLGQTNPDDIYIICAHYDSVTTYCADDNATGVAAVLEVARILSEQCIDNTIVYALWDEEEIGLRGANFYAQQAADTSSGGTRTNILGVINMDMIGYDSDTPGTTGDNDFDIDVRDIANSIAIKDDLLTILNSYAFDLNPIVVDPGTTASDHSRFWNQGYSAVLVGESWETNDQNPFYHTSGDRMVHVDFQYMTEITRLVMAYTATKAGISLIDPTVSTTSDDLTANQVGASYQWVDCNTDTDIPGAISRTFMPSTSGNYAVRLTVNGCSEMSDCISFSVLSVETFNSSELRLYPNPVDSVLKIENHTGTELKMTLSDLTGKHLQNYKISNDGFDLNCETMTDGIYFIQIRSKDKVSTFKIVKH